MFLWQVQFHRGTNCLLIMYLMLQVYYNNEKYSFMASKKYLWSFNVFYLLAIDGAFAQAYYKSRLLNSA